MVKKEIKKEDNRPRVVALILRIGLGLVFIIAGGMKLLMADRFIEMFESLIPMSGLGLSYGIGIIELALGIFLLIGFLTRIMAIIIAVISVLCLVFVMVWVDQNPAHIGLIAAAIALIILGPGNLAVDNLLKS